jgi:hypothetical protein
MCSYPWTIATINHATHTAGKHTITYTANKISKWLNEFDPKVIAGARSAAKVHATSGAKEAAAAAAVQCSSFDISMVARRSLWSCARLLDSTESDLNLMLA